MAPLRIIALLGTGILWMAHADITWAQGDDTSPIAEDPGASPVPIDPSDAPRPALSALAISQPVIIDGELDESVWQTADSATGFVTNLPRVGYPASERTVVRVLYDARSLYIGAVMYDSEIGKVTIPGLEQDFETHDSDLFAVALDTYDDRQNAFLFAVNPAGAIFDAQVFNDSRYTNRVWEGVVHRKTKIHDYGWTAEIAIPFTTLRFERSDRELTWGVNFLRRVRRKNEDAYWAPIDRQYRVHKMSRAGTLTGLASLRQGRNLTVKPYVRADRKVGQLRMDDHGNDVGGGVDIKYGITPRLTLDVTMFTDFSQVEVDEEQVNLTRFSLFFPEKRDFFMENAGVFTFGDVTERNYRTGSSLEDFTLFHSRRIGLSEDRRPVGILTGGRLSGRFAGLDVGLLDVQTRSADVGPAENFAVARVRRAIFGSSEVGAMFINRQVTEAGATGSYNRSWGFDANLRFLQYMIVNAYVAGTEEPNTNGDNKAIWLQLAWRDPVWDLSGFVKHVGESFNPGVGFVRRSALHQAFATVGAHPQPNVPGIIEVNPYVDISLISDLDWSLETRTITGGAGATFVDGGTVSLEYNNWLERLSDIETIAGVELPPGEYNFSDVALSYTASGARALSGEVKLSRGGFYDGDISSVSATAVVRPDHHLLLDLSVQHNDLSLADTSFTADLFGARIRYAYSTQFFASVFVQYNNSADELITNVRLNLIHAPLSDVFLVYNERRNLALDTLLDRVIAAKVTRLFAF
jgi:hypothetical protein